MIVNLARLLTEYLNERSARPQSVVRKSVRLHQHSPVAFDVFDGHVASVNGKCAAPARYGFSAAAISVVTGQRIHKNDVARIAIVYQAYTEHIQLEAAR